MSVVHLCIHVLLCHIWECYKRTAMFILPSAKGVRRRDPWWYMTAAPRRAVDVPISTEDAGPENSSMQQLDPTVSTMFHRARPPLSSTKTQVGTSNWFQLGALPEVNPANAMEKSAAKEQHYEPTTYQQLHGCPAYNLHIDLLRLPWIDAQHMTGIPSVTMLGKKSTALENPSPSIIPRHVLYMCSIHPNHITHPHTHTYISTICTYILVYASVYTLVASS